MTGLPWDDPTHDVAADFRAVVDRVATHGHTETLAEICARASRTPRKNGLTGNLAMAAWPGPAAGEGDGPRPRPPIDLTRRRPLYGDRITHHDVDVDQDRIGAAFEEGLRGTRPPTGQAPHDLGWTREDVQRFGELDYRLRREQNRDSMRVVFRSEPRQAGKTTRMRRYLDAQAAEFERVYGKKPTVFSYGPGHTAIRDEVAHWLNSLPAIDADTYRDMFDPPLWMLAEDLAAEERALEDREAYRRRLHEMADAIAQDGPARRQYEGRWTTATEHDPAEDRYGRERHRYDPQRQAFFIWREPDPDEPIPGPIDWDAAGWMTD